MPLCSPDTNTLSQSPCPESDHYSKGWQPHTPVSVVGLACSVQETEVLCWVQGGHIWSSQKETWRGCCSSVPQATNTTAAMWVIASCMLLLMQFFAVLLADPESTQLPSHHTRTDLPSAQSDFWHLSTNPFPSWTQKKASASLYQCTLC